MSLPLAFNLVCEYIVAKYIMSQMYVEKRINVTFILVLGGKLNICPDVEKCLNVILSLPSM